MPYPAKVSREQIVEQARLLIETEGFAAVSQARLASALDIKAASLYKHFEDKDAILRAVNLQTVELLIKATLSAVQVDQSPHRNLVATAQAYRAHALAHPATYNLALSRLAPEVRPDPAQLEALVLPLQALLVPLCGESDSLTAIRGLFALMHGFIVSELNTQFQRGGDLDQTFRVVVDRYLQGWQRSAAD